MKPIFIAVPLILITMSIQSNASNQEIKLQTDKLNLLKANRESLRQDILKKQRGELINSEEPLEKLKQEFENYNMWVTSTENHLYQLTLKSGLNS